MSDEINQPTAPVGLDDAARLIEALDAPPAKVAEKRKEPPVEQAEVVESSDSDSAGETEHETTTEESADSESGDSEEPETEAEEADEASEPDELMLTVKIDGKTQQITAKEAAEGYMRQADYSRKTQEIAQHRKAIEQYRAQYVEKASKLDEVLPVLVQKMEEYLPAPPDESLLDTDPVAYLKSMRAYERRAQEVQVAREAAQQRMAEREAEEAENFQAYLAEASQALPELIPEWKDSKRAQADKPKIRQYLTQWWSQGEIDQAVDPRMIMLANKARQFDELISSSRKIKPDAPLEKQPIKPTPAGTPNQNKLTARAKDFRAAKNRLAQTGSLQDAADAIKALL